MIILVIYEWLELFHKVRNVLLFTVIFIFFSILRSLYIKQQLQFLRWKLPFKGHSHVCENFVKIPLGYLSYWLHFKWEKEDYKGTSWGLYFLTHNFSYTNDILQVIEFSSRIIL